MTLDRRSVLGGVGIATGVMPILSACSDSLRGLPFADFGAKKTMLNISTPREHLEAILRMSASLEEEDCPWWFNGTVYGIIGEEQPVPLMNIEGMEIYHVSHLGENVYEMTGNTATFFRDVETNAFLYEYKNPFTGKVVDVPASVQGGGPGRGFTYEESGIRPTMFKDKMPDKPPHFEWHMAGEYVWAHSSREYPPGMTTPRAERQSTFARKEDFLNPAIKKLMSSFTSTFFSPWMDWLGMDDRPGHVIWHAGGAKLNSLDDLPQEYRERVERDHPDRLTGKPAAGTGGKKVE